MNEIEIARIVIEWLRHDGWNVYEEVRTGYGEHRADIVGERHGITHVVEVKRSLGLGVIAQAIRWRNQAHYVSVAVPRTKRSKKSFVRDHGRDLAYRICRENGIGILEINGKLIDDRVKPVMNRKAKKDYQFVGDYLHALHEEYGVAGSRNEYFTPFRETCKSLTDVVFKHPEGIRFKDAVDIIKTEWHYRSEQSGRSALGKFLAPNGSKVLPRIDARMEGRSYVLYPISDSEEAE